MCLTPQHNEHEAVHMMIEAFDESKTGIPVLYVSSDLSNHLLSPLSREETKALLTQGHIAQCRWNN